MAFDSNISFARFVSLFFYVIQFAFIYLLFHTNMFPLQHLSLPIYPKHYKEVTFNCFGLEKKNKLILNCFCFCFFKKLMIRIV